MNEILWHRTKGNAEGKWETDGNNQGSGETSHR